MRRNPKCLFAAVCVAWLGAATAAFAQDAVRWHLADVRFEKGAAVTGWFEFDAAGCSDPQGYRCKPVDGLDWHLTVGRGDSDFLSAFTYTPINSRMENLAPDWITLVTKHKFRRPGSNEQSARSLTLRPAFQLPRAGGLVPLRSREGFENFSGYRGNPGRYVTAGSLAAEVRLDILYPGLRAKFRELLRQRLVGDNEDLFIESLLPSTRPIDRDRFRNTFNVTRADVGVQATLQEFFLLTDIPFPLDAGSGSVLRSYELIVDAASCRGREAESHPGCRLWRLALADLAEPKRDSSRFRAGGPQWRLVGADPVNWAESQTPWERLRLEDDGAVLEADYLPVQAVRGWLSPEFLASDDWYISGQCAGYVSDGDPNNNGSTAGRELLPQIPVGLIFTKDLTLTYNGAEASKQNGVYLSGWILKSIPFSPRLSDPRNGDCRR